MRSRLGIEISQNTAAVENVKPAAGSDTTTMLYSCQTLPDDEAEELGKDRPLEVARVDGLAAVLALLCVFGVPVVDLLGGADSTVADIAWLPQRLCPIGVQATLPRACFRER